MNRRTKGTMEYIEEHRFFHEDEISRMDICKLSGKTLDIMILENKDFGLIIGTDKSFKESYLLRKIDKRKCSCLWDELRVAELKEVIITNILNKERLSVEWIEEYNDLIK